MDTTYLEEVYDFFFSKIKTYDEFINLNAEDLNEELLIVLRASLSRIFEFDDITIDFDMECFNRALNDLEKELIALGMVGIWIEQKVNNIENFEQFLGTKDYSFYSQANHLKELINAKDSNNIQQKNLLIRYSTKKFISKRGRR